MRCLPHSRLARVSTLITLLCAAACKKEAPPPRLPVLNGSGASAPSSPPAAAQAPEFPPLPPRELLATTSGNLAMENLESDLQNAEKLLAASPYSAELLMRVVPMFLMHAKTTGTLQEYDRALSLAESAAKLAPKNPQTHSTLSSVHSTLHRFDEAFADLQRAQTLGYRGIELDASRAALFQALGRYAEARPIMEKLVDSNPRIDTIGALATLEADEGNIAAAERRFLEAQNTFSDVAPFPLVWLWFQQGLMWQKEGRLSRARELFSAAHERLPADVAVAAHLAGMQAATGDRQRAIALLWPVVKSSDDPEYLGQLSQLLREEGDVKQADELREKAISRYDLLIKRHPAAFAEHAARFWLGPGGDVNKALPLALLNLTHRKTPDAYGLALESHLANKAPAPAAAAAACQLAESATAPPAKPPARLRVLASRAFFACGKKERGEAELAAVASKSAPAAPAAPPAAAAPAAVAAPATAASPPAPVPAAPAVPVAPAAPAAKKK